MLQDSCWYRELSVAFQKQLNFHEQPHSLTKAGSPPCYMYPTSISAYILHKCHILLCSWRRQSPCASVNRLKDGGRCRVREGVSLQGLFPLVIQAPYLKETKASYSGQYVDKGTILAHQGFLEERLSASTADRRGHSGKEMLWES